MSQTANPVTAAEIKALQVSGKLADNERLKRESNFLRGTIEPDLSDGLTGGFNGDNFQLIRFHGMYQQDDRDIRPERAKQKLEPLHNVMLRARLPGGVITPQQWLGIDRFAADNTLYGSLRLTTRQTFQFHGVLKRDIRLMHQTLHQMGLDSIATAGDVNRNVLCTTNPEQSQLHSEAYQWAKQISEHLLPQTQAYAEIWLNGEKAVTTQEPILGPTYLPRKFKTCVVIPPQNDVDVHANDLSFVAIAGTGKQAGRLVGFNVLVGGGLSMTHGDRATFPATATDFGFIPLQHTLAVAEAVVTTQRDLGNRVNRKNAKTRYTLERVGADRFKQIVEQRAGVQFKPSRPYEFTGRGDRFGWVEGIDGNHHLTLFIENGRVLDFPDKPLKTGLAKIAEVHQGEFRMTADQNLIIAGVPPEQKEQIEQLARAHGLLDDSVTEQRRSAMACVALPTCPLAMAEAERMLPEFVTQTEQLLAKHGLDTLDADNAIITRVTGCPNGCGRAMLAEVGLVGKGPGKYNLYLGGDHSGNRIPRLYRENISTEAVLSELDPLIGRWATERGAGEGFGDYLIRAAIVRPVVDPARDFHE